MSQTTITQIQGTEETTVVVKRPKPSKDDAINQTRGMAVVDAGDENLIQQFSIAEFVNLGAVCPEKFKKNGKVAFREYTNDKKEVKLLVSFIVNGKWEHMSPSKSLQAELKAGDPISVSKHAIQLRLNPDAKENEAPCYYLVTKVGGSSKTITLADFAD